MSAIRLVCVGLAVCVLLTGVSLGYGADGVVTTLADGGPGSLREAIVAANASPGSSITFAPALAGGTITLASNLPALTADNTVVGGDIDGDSLPDVTIDGAGVATVGLAFTSSGNRVQSLSLRRCGTGILMTTGDNVVEGCHVANCERGIASNGCAVTVAGNQISACSSAIEATGGTALIEMNEVSGGAVGICVCGGCQATIHDNWLADCPGVAISARDVGTTAEMSFMELQNCGIGVQVSRAAGVLDNINIYSPSTVGIALDGPGASATIIGCYIENAGTDGVRVSDHAQAPAIGDWLSPNEITGCGQSGISLMSAASATAIAYNLIHGNTGDGMRFSGGSTADVGELNQIFDNGGNGVTVLDDGTRVHIDQNQIHDNGGLGIDLGGDGVTPNGPMGSGPNKSINYPVVTHVEPMEGWENYVSVEGVAPAGATVNRYIVAPDPSGYGEGREVSVDGFESYSDGTFHFMADISERYTFTATDAEGNTSEFSSWRWPVPNAGPDQWLEATSPAGAEVVLDGSGSINPTGGPLEYLWTWTAADGSQHQADGVGPTVALSCGETEITLRVTDEYGTSMTDAVYVYVEGPPDSDADGVPESVEDAAPNNGDGNGDGTPDSQQDNVVSLPNSADGEYVTLECDPGTRLGGVAAVANPSPDDAPSGATFPVGFLQYGVFLPEPGAATTVTIHLPAGHAVSTYYKYGPTADDATSHWYQFAYDGTTGAEIQADRVILHFVDGQRGDSDLQSDGVVTDPGGPAATAPASSLAPVVFATNSIHLEQNATVNSGDVIANQVSPGPYLADDAELTVGIGVQVAAGCNLYADSIKVKMNADVSGDVHENELDNNGHLHGQTVTPLSLPVLPGSPACLVATPGTGDVTVAQNATITLPPGAYRDVLVRKGGKVTFTGGTYHFRSLDTGDNVRLEFAAPSDVRIADKFDTDLNNTIGPVPGSEVTAAQIVFYIAGVNGSSGALSATPKAAQIGIANEVLANFVAPNGTLWLRQNSICTGAFIGRDVDLGIGADVHLASAFSAADYSVPAGTAQVSPHAAPAVQVSSAAAVATSAGAQIVFTLSSEADVMVTLTNIAGRPVRRLAAGRTCAAGLNTLLWDGRSDHGTIVPGGMYLVHVTARASGGAQGTALTALRMKR